MTLLHFDGFDNMGVNNENVSSVLTAGDYLSALIALQDTAIVRTGRAALKLSSAGEFRYRTPGTQTTLINGMGYYKDTGNAEAEVLGHMEFNTGSTHIAQLKLSRTTNNALRVENGDGTVIATSSIQEFNLQGWQFLEWKAFCDASAGSTVVRIDEKEIINVTGVTTWNNTAGSSVAINQVFWDRPTRNAIFDDFYVCNDSGSVNNDFLGAIEVHTLMPNADGTTNQWTAVGAANNWQTVDELDSDSDTTYVHASTLQDKELYAIEQVSASATITNVFGVKLDAMVRKESAGANALKLISRLSTTEVSSTTKTIDTGYAIISHVFETRPGGGNWDLANVSAMEAGFIIVSTNAP